MHRLRRLGPYRGTRSYRWAFPVLVFIAVIKYRSMDTEKSFRNLIKSNRNQIVSNLTQQPWNDAATLLFSLFFRHITSRQGLEHNDSFWKKSRQLILKLRPILSEIFTFTWNFIIFQHFSQILNDSPWKSKSGTPYFYYKFW